MYHQILEMTRNTDKAKKFFLKNLAYNIGPYELNHVIRKYIKDINIIDVREYEDYIEGHIPFAIHMPLSKIDENIKLLNKDIINIVYCYREECQLAKKVCLKLAEMGYPVLELNGGFKSWQEYDFDIVKTSD